MTGLLTVSHPQHLPSYELSCPLCRKKVIVGEATVTYLFSRHARNGVKLMTFTYTESRFCLASQQKKRKGKPNFTPSLYYLPIQNYLSHLEGQELDLGTLYQKECLKSVKQEKKPKTS